MQTFETMHSAKFKIATLGCKDKGSIQLEYDEARNQFLFQAFSLNRTKSLRKNPQTMLRIEIQVAKFLKNLENFLLKNFNLNDDYLDL